MGSRKYKIVVSLAIYLVFTPVYYLIFTGQLDYLDSKALFWSLMSGLVFFIPTPSWDWIRQKLRLADSDPSH